MATDGPCGLSVEHSSFSRVRSLAKLYEVGCENGLVTKHHSTPFTANCLVKALASNPPSTGQSHCESNDDNHVCPTTKVAAAVDCQPAKPPSPSADPEQHISGVLLEQLHDHCPTTINGMKASQNDSLSNGLEELSEEDEDVNVWMLQQIARHFKKLANGAMDSIPNELFIEDFLTLDECSTLMKVTELGRRKSLLIGYLSGKDFGVFRKLADVLEDQKLLPALVKCLRREPVDIYREVACCTQEQTGRTNGYPRHSTFSQRPDQPQALNPQQIVSNADKVNCAHLRREFGYLLDHLAQELSRPEHHERENGYGPSKYDCLLLRLNHPDVSTEEIPHKLLLRLHHRTTAPNIGPDNLCELEEHCEAVGLDRAAQLVKRFSVQVQKTYRHRCTEPGMSTVRMKMRRDHHTFSGTEAKKTKAKIARLTEMDVKDICFLCPHVGCVLLCFGLPPKAARRLQRLAFCRDDRLVDMGVSSVQVNDEEPIYVSEGDLFCLGKFQPSHTGEDLASVGDWDILDSGKSELLHAGEHFASVDDLDILGSDTNPPNGLQPNREADDVAGNTQHHSINGSLSLMLGQLLRSSEPLQQTHHVTDLLECVVALTSEELMERSKDAEQWADESDHFTNGLPMTSNGIGGIAKQLSSHPHVATPVLSAQVPYPKIWQSLSQWMQTISKGKGTYFLDGAAYQPPSKNKHAHLSLDQASPQPMDMHASLANTNASSERLIAEQKRHLLPPTTRHLSRNDHLFQNIQEQPTARNGIMDLEGCVYQSGESMSLAKRTAWESGSPSQQFVMDWRQSQPSDTDRALTTQQERQKQAVVVFPILQVCNNHHDTGTFTQKVIIPNNAVRRLVTPYMSVIHSSENKEIDFCHLNKMHVKTIGLYGNVKLIAQYLLDLAGLDQQGIDSLNHGPPGIHCVSSGSSLQYLVFCPTENAFTDLSGENISCKMIRCLLELCDEVLTFYSGDELDMFNAKPCINLHMEKKQRKMVKSYKKDFEEGVQFVARFPPTLLDAFTMSAGTVTNRDIQLAHSCHILTLYTEEMTPKKVGFQSPQIEWFSPKKLQEFWQEKMKAFTISFPPSAKDTDVLDVLKHASAEFMQMFSVMEQAIEDLDKKMREEKKDLQAKQNEEKEICDEKLSKAVNAYICEHSPCLKLFFPDVHEETTGMLHLEPQNCINCFKLLTPPQNLGCQRTCCKECYLKCAVQTGQKTESDVLISCPDCHDEEEGDLEQLPDAHHALTQHMDHNHIAAILEANNEAEQRRQLKLEEAISYIMKHIIKSALQREQPCTYLRKPRNISELLVKKLQQLERMGRAYVLYSLALEKKWIGPQEEEGDQMKAVEFVSRAHDQYNGEAAVKHFVENTCLQRCVTQVVIGGHKPTSEEELRQMEKEHTALILKNPSAVRQPDIFSDRECWKKANDVKETMTSLFKQHVQFVHEVERVKRSSEREKVTIAMKKSLKKETLEKMKLRLREALASGDNLSLEIQSIRLLKKGNTQFSFNKDYVCRLTFREEHKSSTTHVYQVYQLDLLKADHDKSEGHSTKPIEVPQQITRTVGCFPVNPNHQELVRMYSLTAGKFLVFLREKNRKGIDIYIQKPIDYRKQSMPPQPSFQLKRDYIDLVDFDEDTHLAAFHVPGKQQVDVYHVDTDWRQWALKCQINLWAHKGYAELTHMVFMPGQEKLCLIDNGGLCHIFDINDSVMRKRTILIDVPIKCALVSLDGSFLLIFTTKPDTCSECAHENDSTVETSCTEDEGHAITADAEGAFLSTSGPNFSKPKFELTIASDSDESHDEIFESEGKYLSFHCEKNFLETVAHDSANEVSPEPSITTIPAGHSVPESPTVFEHVEQVDRKENVLDAVGCKESGKKPGMNRHKTCQQQHVVVHIYSLVNYSFIEAVTMDVNDFPPEVLPSLRLVMTGPQMHMVAINKSLKCLISRTIDVKSARKVSLLTDFDQQSLQGSQTNKPAKGGRGNYLDYLYHVYEKFCIEDCLRTSRRTLNLTCVLEQSSVVIEQQLGGGWLCQHYIETLFQILSDSTHKPMSHFTQNVSVTDFATCCQSPPEPRKISLRFGDWLQRLICLVPIQICCAEQNQLTLFSNCLKPEPNLLAPTVIQLQENIEFGFYEAILDWWAGPVKVVSSMGKQSTGKSYMLNHLTGSLFDISGDRCTDGVWLTMRVGHDCLYVVLDFEGFGSRKRSEQEDLFLLVMNATISGLTLFKTEFHVDDDTLKMMSLLHYGVELIKSERHLLRGWLYICIKDVDKRDIPDLETRFCTKLQDICMGGNKNFLTKMYGRQLAVQASPHLGNADFYTEMDQIRHHLQSEKTPSFHSGREFKDAFKLLLAKIHMQEWSSFDRMLAATKINRLHHGLPEAVSCGHLIDQNNEEEQLKLSSGEPVPDILLEIADDQSVLPLHDRVIILGRDKTDRDSVQKLVDIFINFHGSRDFAIDHQEWSNKFQKMLTQIIERRRQRVNAWLDSHLGGFMNYGDVRILQSEVKDLLTKLQQDWSLCRLRCTQCFSRCLLLQNHDKDHDCMGTHECQHVCDFCQDDQHASENIDVRTGEADHQKCSALTEDSCDCNGGRQEQPMTLKRIKGEVLQCGDKAGHCGKHDCKWLSHTCSETCVLLGKYNCNQYCAKKSGHQCDPADEEHRCNARQHLCGQECSLPNCKNKCISPYELTHERHACQDTACPKKCCIATCNNKCAKVKDHFHDIPADHGEPVKHFCGMEHQCQEECQSDGICEIASERIVTKKLLKTPMGDRCEYLKTTAQTGSRKKCCIALPPNRETHEGDHSCTLDPDCHHFCDQRCPCCGYFCTLRFKHIETLHSTTHGKVRLTRAKIGKDFSVVDRQGNGHGEGEMCNFLCKRLGRGHVHNWLCQDHAKSKTYCTMSEANRKRQKTCKFTHDRDMPYDFLSHKEFWTTIGFEDPYTKEEQHLFNLCPKECLSIEHDRNGTKSFCTGELWHSAYQLSDLASLGGDGHIHSSGHHFKCVHSKAGPLHHVLIVDNSGSMAGTDCQPSLHTLKASHNNRLGAVIDACNQYLTMREANAQNDIVSFISFGPTATVHFRGLALDAHSLLQRMMEVQVSGGTDSSSPLQCANEVIKSAEQLGKRNCVVIVLSGGRASFDESHLRSLLQNRVNRGNMIRFHCIKFGHVHSPELQRMADIAQAFSVNDHFASQSSYFLAVDSLQLAEHFEQLARSLNKGSLSSE